MNSSIVFSVAAALMSVIYLAYLLYFRHSSSQRAKHKKLMDGDNANTYDSLFSVKKIVVAACLALIFIINLVYQLAQSNADAGGVLLFTFLILLVAVVTFSAVYSMNKPKK